MENLYLSKEMKDVLIKNAIPERNKIHVGEYEIPVYESPLFPFEIHYDACDVETRQLVKVGSGEFIHGAMIPKINIECDPISWEFSFDKQKSEMRCFLESRWHMEIFKF